MTTSVGERGRLSKPGLRRVTIAGLATYVPPRVLTNADLEKMVETSDEWIQQRTGIRERHIVDAGVATSDLAKEASLKAIAQALRVQSDSMRTRRKQIAEEKAAKTAVKLIFPLVLFIFPGIFVVLVGPAAIVMVREMFPMMNKGG